MTAHNDTNIEASNITEQVDSRLDDLFGDEDFNDTNTMPLKNEKRSKEISPAGNDALPPQKKHMEVRDHHMKRGDNDGGNDHDKINTADLENSPINELKSIILSLEWEISDPVMQKLEDEIRKLENICRDDKIILAFLQLLGSLGKYIRNKLARAHVDSITLLHAVYESLEKAMLSEKLSDAAKKKLLIAHVTEYKKLKEEIQAGKKGSRRGKMPEALSHASPIQAFPSSQTREVSSDAHDLSYIAQEILNTVKEMQQTIQHELSMLRDEMRHLSARKK